RPSSSSERRPAGGPTRSGSGDGVFARCRGARDGRWSGGRHGGSPPGPPTPGRHPMRTTRFTLLVGCSAPIQPAGRCGVATPPLAAAVAGAGGLGMVAGVMVRPHELAAALDAMPDVGDGAIGVNFLLPFLEAVDAVEVAASRARVVELFYGDPDPELVE